MQMEPKNEKGGAKDGQCHEIIYMASKVFLFLHSNLMIHLPCLHQPKLMRLSERKSSRLQTKWQKVLLQTHGFS